MFAVDGEVLQQALQEERTSGDASANSSFDEAGNAQGGSGKQEKRYRFHETRSGFDDGGERRSEVISGLPAAIQSLKGSPTIRSTRHGRIPTSFMGLGPTLSTIPGSTLYSAQQHENDESAKATEIVTPLESRRVGSEPDMNFLDITPDLIPPPEFQERFKFVVCSSRLLHDRPNFDGKRGDTLVQHGIGLATGHDQGLELSFAGLGIEGTTMNFNEAATHEPSRDDGLRRRRAPSPLVDVNMSCQPASFRRLSSATSIYSGSTPLCAGYPTTISADSGWRFLAYMPFFCTLAPYTEPVVLLLSCSLWILQIVGWIWLEVLAAMAIALCGILNIIVRSFNEKEVSREEIKRRKGIRVRMEKKDGKRRHVEKWKNSVNEPSTHDVNTEENRTLRTTPIASDQKALENPTATLETICSHHEPLQQHEHAKGDNGSQSLHGLALESLQSVVAEADQMDEVIGQALSMIRDSESALAPLVSEEALQTLEVMYRVEETEAPLSPTWTASSLPTALGFRRLDEDFLMFSPSDVSNKRVSQSTDSVTSGGNEEEMMEPLHRKLHQTGGVGTVPVNRNRARSSLDPQGKDFNPVLRNVQSFHGLTDSGYGSGVQDKFTPLPVRSPRLSQRQGSNLKRATSLKEKTSSGTIRPRREDTGEVRQLQSAWRYPITLQEESDASQSLSNPNHPTKADIFPQPGPIVGDEETLRSIAIPTNPKGKLRELKLSQSGMGGFSQPGTTHSSSPQFGLSRTPEEGRDPMSYFAAGTGQSATTQMTLRRKRSSLQSLRYRNPDGTTVIASSPARHHRTRSSVDILPNNVNDFINNLPKGIVNGLQKPSRNSRAISSEASPRISERDSLLSDHRPPSMTARYPSSPAFHANQQPRLQRAISFGHLTLTSLKAAFLAIHLKRKRIACELLALDFSAESIMQREKAHIRQVAFAKYWADVHIILDDLQAAMNAITKDIKSTLATCKESAYRYEPFLPGRPHESFAPRLSDESVMLEQIHVLTRLLASAQNELVGLRSSVQQQNKQEIIHQWDQLRMDLAAMIRTWEKGRAVASRSNVYGRADGGLDGDYNIAESLPDFIRHWDVDDAPELDIHGADTSNDASVSSPMVDEATSATNIAAFDDASTHLLNSTSSAFLPPPGIEDVFEALLERPVVVKSLVGPDGKKLSREERIRHQKEIRKKALHGKSKVEPGFGPSAVAPTTRSRNGAVVKELQEVIAELRERRTAASPTVQ
ncbi:hypothetical protein QFC21_001457 [Naganishia friedmannii]|uniref:Uncharacterized protein n=1 Tax=Naganishia friedmannii TaxID=89922 RepID=A0ACC2W3W3_9TREE|nr:hypothetical protein QFC21_001457 [Naganishia friedmannii]